MTQTAKKHQIEKVRDNFFQVARLVKNTNYFVNKIVPKSSIRVLVYKIEGETNWTVSHNNFESKENGFEKAIKVAKKLLA